MLFDLSLDPNEEHDLSATEPERAMELAQALDAALAKLRDARVEPGTALLGSEELDQLKALGYVE